MSSPVVLITGSSSGIGKALCWAFHHQGYRAIATARQLQPLADLKAAGIVTLPLDVTDPIAIQQVTETVLADQGRIDILINNAGFGQFGPLMDLSPTQLQDQFQTNVWAPLAMVQQIAPIMKQQGSGLIINIGSISGVVTTPFSGAYCASKAALHSLSEALRLELSPFGITVITVQPGAIQSNFGQASQQHLDQVITPNSWYAPFEQAIQARATLSQVNATPAETFAAQLVAKIQKPNPPAIIRLGKKSHWLPWVKQLLPARLLEFILKRRFNLNRYSNRHLG